MNDKDSLNLIEEIKQLKKTIVDLNKNLEKYNDNIGLGCIDWSETEPIELDNMNIKEIEKNLDEQIEMGKYFSSLGKDINTDNDTKELIEITKQIIPILKEWIKEHKKGDEWKNEQ